MIRRPAHLKRTLALAVVAYLLVVAACAGWAGLQASQVVATLRSAAGGAPADALARAGDQAASLGGAVNALRALAWPLLRLAEAARPLPGVGPVLAAVPVLLDAGAPAAEAGRSALLAVAPAAGAMSGAQGMPEMLARLRANREGLLQAERSLAAAADRLSDLPPASTLPAPLARAAEALPALLTRGRGALALAATAPALLGADAPRAYLLLGQNNDELRATGGFISTGGVMRVENGRVGGLDYRDSYDFDGTKPRVRRVPPPPLERFMLTADLRLRDANWWADFPTSARAVQSILLQDQDQRVDGVVAFDQDAVRAILRQLGPIDVAAFGERVDADNLIELLEVYAHPPGYKEDFEPEVDRRRVVTDDRKQIVKDLAAGLMARVLALDGSDLRGLATVGLRLLEEKHLLLAMNAVDEARALSTLGWDGAVNAAPEGDALLVTESNVGYSKANRTVQTRLDYTVEVPSRVEAPSATLTVTYTNSNTAPARHCNVAIIDYATSDDSCYKSYVRVYVPAGTVPLGVDGSATPYEWFAEGNRSVLAGVMVLGPGETKALRFRYTLPRSVLPINGSYQLLLQKQAGVRDQQVSLNILGRRTELTLVADRPLSLPVG